MLISLSEVFETPVSTLIGETISESQVDDLKAISQKLEVTNLQLSQRATRGRRALQWVCISVCVLIAAILFILLVLDSPYLHWDYSDPEMAVMGVAFHAFEWIFVRLSPLVFIGSFAGILLTRKRC